MDEYADLFDGKGQIRHDKIEDLLVEVVSGRYLYGRQDQPDVLLASRCPTAKEQDDARIIFTRALRVAKAKGLMLRADLEALALSSGLFKPGERDEKNSLLTMMERQQKAKERSGDERQKAQLTTEIEISRRRLMEIEIGEFSVLQHSAEIKSEETRTGYFISCCTLGGEMLDQPIWGSYQEYLTCGDWALLQEARRGFGRVQMGLPVHVLRAIARTTEWRVRWKSCKESGSQPFDGAAPNWSRTQVNLIYWSDFYDNIYQHPDCPDDATINDDAALTDWINAQVQKKKQAPQGPRGRPTPTYRDGAGRRKPMTKVGQDQVINVGTPYKIRV